MKKLIQIIAVALLTFTTSCDDHLDTKNLYSVSSDNYYKTPEQINEAMAGVYNALYAPDAVSDEHLIAELLSDVVFSGGGSDDIAANNIATFIDPLEDTHKGLWLQTYRGVARANAILEAVEKNDFSNYFSSATEAQNFKNKTLAEAYFMRGFLYFRAARMFGGMPLIVKTVGPHDVARATFGETFGQIASDFDNAIKLFPEVNINNIQLAEYGRANIWTAKAYLARTYMHFCGYMTNIEKQATDVVVLPDGTAINKAQVVAHLEDIQTKSGHELTPDFRNLWPYSHINTVAGSNVLPWAATNNLAWVGQDGPHSTIGTGNKEVMFALRYANGNWAPDDRYRNWVVLYFGVRKNSMIPFGEGWGWGTIHPQFFSGWSNDDMRKSGSVLVLGDATQGTDAYQGNQGMYETGLFNKKYTPIQFSDNGTVTGMFRKLYGSGEDSYMMWHAQDFYYLRYADVLLMHAELTQTANGLNAVRSRAYGAAHVDVPYTLENLKRERLHEFAFEGVRWFDLVRWGDVAGNANYYGVEADVMNEGVAAKYRRNYRTVTKGLRPIPESEIRLSNGAYQQNAGWE